MHANPKKAAPLVVLVLAALAASWYFSNRQAITSAAPGREGALSASGSIESTQIEIAPELSGRVAEVLVEEGEKVESGEVLLRFDQALLTAQLHQAQATLAQAEANYNLVAAGTPAEQRQRAIAAARLELISARQALDDLYKNAALVAASTAQEVAAADKALDLASQRLDNLNTSADPADVEAAEAAVVIAKDRLDRAKKDFRPYEKKATDNLIRARLQAEMAEAQQRYDQVVSRLNNLTGTSNQYDLALAESEKALAQARLEDARRRYQAAKDGPDPEAVSLAEARVKSAEANLNAAQANTSQEQLDVAQAQVDAARSAVEIIQTQMEKLTLAAPMQGVLLSRHVEPGEVVVAGAPLLTLARLDRLTITIYLPEDRYGTIVLGQEAVMSVDSFPGDTFSATVVQIADQAEFTPRNVQTSEGRRTMVFAVKLAVENPDGRLKPGMPADVTFK
mgnify:CR=1 FL=1